MAEVKLYDVVRATRAVESLNEARTVPVGSVGTVVEVTGDGTVLVDFELELPNREGDYVSQAVLLESQYEVVAE